MTVIQKQRWTGARDAMQAFLWRSGAQTERLAVLNAIWDKECGSFAKHWSLVAVRRGALYIHPKSAAAAQELHLRSHSLIRSLNKYFSRPWISAVRTTYR